MNVGCEPWYRRKFDEGVDWGDKRIFLNGRGGQMEIQRGKSV